MEIWKDIPGYEGHFQVSSLGRVKSLERVVENHLVLHGKPRKRLMRVPEKIRKTPPNKFSGYPEVSLSVNGETKLHHVHKLVTTAFIGQTPAGLEVRHKNGVKTNAALSNLHFGTPKQNGEDRIEHGTSNAGETNGMHKLTESDVLNIRSLRGKTSVIAIAQRYGLSRTYVYAIFNRKVWNNL